MMNSLGKSIGAIISIDNKTLAGQMGAILSRSAEPIEITNKIDQDWKNYLVGSKEWSIRCNGCYVVNEESLNKLEEAFMNNIPVNVSIVIGNTTYFGDAIIIDFPLDTPFGQSIKYNLNLLGITALERI